MRTLKPIIKNPRLVNNAEIARALRFSREYVRLIILGLKTNPQAVAKVKNAIKEQLKAA
jgi:hypothetical protein